MATHFQNQKCPFPSPKPGQPN